MTKIGQLRDDVSPAPFQRRAFRDACGILVATSPDRAGEAEIDLKTTDRTCQFTRTTVLGAMEQIRI